MHLKTELMGTKKKKADLEDSTEDMRLKHQGAYKTRLAILYLPYPIDNSSLDQQKWRKFEFICVRKCKYIYINIWFLEYRRASIFLHGDTSE